ncbi:MAG: thiolase domain-containing protein [Candidatus Diapherotrites archaeon]|nr:thiolase domain-containing protein [Candidatus Diapherotrites archaeon]
MQKVAVIGAGQTKFGEHWEKSFRDLMAEAGKKAIEDANISGNDIQAVYGGTMSAGRMIGQEHIGALIADSMGLNPIPSTRVENACASGGTAFREAYMAIAGGHYDIVVAGGVEKMTDVFTSQASLALGGAADQEWEVFFGATFPALYALIARRHMHEYGTTEEQMARVAVKNHHNGSLNPNAQYRRDVTLEQVMSSSKVADPLKLLDCSPITDGAAAVVLASEKIARKYCDDPIWVLGSAQASDTLALHDRESLTTLKSSVIAGREAMKQAGVKPTDINIAEVHDCFTIAEICAVEDLGFVEKGKGGKAEEDGMFDLNSNISVNPSGGLKACGHPVGATGIKQVIEAVEQLRGEAGKRQVDGAETALTHNVGGTGATAVVHIFSKEGN